MITGYKVRYCSFCGATQPYLHLHTEKPCFVRCGRCGAQTAVFRVLAPIIDKRLPELSYSSRKGYGGHRLAKKVSRFVRTKKDGAAKYALYFDLKKYYDHLAVDTIVAALGRIVKDGWVLATVRAMFENAGDGLPIGYVGAHHLANLVAGRLFRAIRAVKGVAYGSVYMDNFHLFSRYKAPLKRAFRTAKERGAESGLEIKGDWQIFPLASRGAHIAGLIVTPRRLPRLYHRTMHRLRRNMDRFFAAESEQATNRLAASLCSRYGWLKAVRKEHIIYDRIKKEKQKCALSILATAQTSSRYALSADA